MPNSECELPVAPPRRRKKLKSVQLQLNVDHEVDEKRTSPNADRDDDRYATDVPRPPPRRRRQSRDSHSSVISDHELEFNVRNTSDSRQNPTSPQSSKLLCCDMNRTIQTTTPAQTNRSRINMEQPDKENQWSNFNTSNSLYLRGTVSGKLHSSETFPTCNDALSGTDNLSKSTDENYYKMNEKKENVNDGDDDDVDDKRDILASWKRKNGHFRRHVINTNSEHYRHGSSFHAVIFEPGRVSEEHPKHSRPLFQSAVFDAPGHSESADKKVKAMDKGKKHDSVGDDYDDDVFVTCMKEKDRDFRQVFNENSQRDRTSSSFGTITSEPAVPFSEPFPTRNSPLSQRIIVDATNSPKSVDEHSEVGRAAYSEVEEEPSPDYDDDDDDDIFTSWKNKNEYVHRGVNGGWSNGHGINWNDDAYQQNRKCQSVDVAAECDDHFQITSPISASGYERDIDDVFTTNGNVKHNGYRASKSNGRCWWPASRPSTNGRMWNKDDLETHCADLLAWQRQQRMQRQQRTANLYLAKTLPRQPLADGLSSKELECGRRNDDKKSGYSHHSTFSSLAENNREIPANVNRNILQINGGGDVGPTHGNTHLQTCFDATTVSYGAARMNGCGAELPSGNGKENGEKEKEDVSANCHQNGFHDATEIDSLAACRMTLFEDVKLSSDDSTTSPGLSTVHNVFRPPSVASSPLVVEIKGLTSKNFPDTAPTDVTTTRLGKISSNIDGFSVTTSPDIDSVFTDNATSGSRPCDTAHKGFGAGNVGLINFEPRNSSTASPILPAASSLGLDARLKLPTIAHSVRKKDRLANGTDDRLNGAVDKNLRPETVICGEARSSGKSSICDIKGYSINGDRMQHDTTADKVYDGMYNELKDGTAIDSEARSFSTSSVPFSAVSYFSDVQHQSTTKNSVSTGERQPDVAVEKVNDSSWLQNVCNANVPWSTDESLETEIQSPIACASVGWPRGPTPWSARSYDSCGSRMKGLRIPSASTSSSATTTTPSEDRRRCLDLPLIAGTTDRRIGDSSSSSVLPATLLPRPFMPRSYYHSVTPSFSTASTLRGTENKVRGGGFNTTLSPLTNSVEDSTTVIDVDLLAATSCPISSARSEPNAGDIRLLCSTSPAVKEPDHELDDWTSTFRVVETSTPQTNGVKESSTSGGTEKPARTLTMHLTEVADLESFQSTDDSPESNIPDATSSTTGSRTTALACYSVPYGFQKLNIREVENVTESRIPEDVYVSPNLGTPGQSLPVNDCQQPERKLLPPPTMPKPTLSRPVPPATRVTDPLLPLSSSLHHPLIQDDAPVISSADLAARGRTTPDGGSDSDTREDESSTSFPTSTTSSAGQDAAAMKAATALNSYSSHDDTSIAVHMNDVTVQKKMIDKEVTNETKEVVTETAEMNGSKFGTVNNGVNHSTAEHAGTSSISAKFTADLRRKLRDRRQANGSCDGRTDGMQRQINTDEVSKDVDGSSDQREAETISLQKGIFGLGFCIEGGRDCPTGRAPVTVKRIFRGDVAARYVLSPGDEIISVDGKQFAELSLYEAWNYLKALPDGVVSLCVKRHNKPAPPVLVP